MVVAEQLQPGERRQAGEGRVVIACLAELFKCDCGETGQLPHLHCTRSGVCTAFIAGRRQDTTGMCTLKRGTALLMPVLHGRQPYLLRQPVT